MSDESATRKEIIDKRLAEAGWNVVDPTQVVLELSIAILPAEKVAESAVPYVASHYGDYGLLGKDGKPLAVVEAKKSSQSAEIGREQAKQYCLNIQAEHGGELPFCFYTNGHEIFFWDIGNYPPRRVVGFPTRDDLQRMQYVRRSRKPLTHELIDHNTFGVFQCEDGLPTFAYTYEEAVNNSPPYLCNFQVMKIQTRFQMEGISKRTISLEDQKRLLLEGKEVEEINFEGSQLEKKVTNKGTNTLIVREFMEECIKDPNGVLPGKTIFFCTSKAHARRLEEVFDELFPQYAGELAKVLVSDDPRVYGKGDRHRTDHLPAVHEAIGRIGSQEASRC